jgi:quercetin dioxygenase-like cupin family protein
LHVAPQDLRVVRQGDLLVRFATLGPVAYVLAEVPPAGSVGTSLEQPCEQPHWGLVIDGRLTLATDSERIDIPAGRAFHVPPGGPAHTLETAGAAVIAGFQPMEPAADVSDASLRGRGFEPVARSVGPTVAPALAAEAVEPGEVRVDEWRMSGYVLARVRMGERTGYTSGWCDAPHWGLVTAGRLAIEWEHDVEVLSTGDVFHCPAGPPGHRIEAADPTTFIDLTPVSSFESGCRLADWRRRALRAAPPSGRGIAVTALG